uniref:(northern house mosquito) hypothetical protein n=1 Tax=Culex pipiens TaxID=7175 RepID=A0A8D8FLP2_CULPI
MQPSNVEITSMTQCFGQVAPSSSTWNICWNFFGSITWYTWFSVPFHLLSTGLISFKSIIAFIASSGVALINQSKHTSSRSTIKSFKHRNRLITCSAPTFFRKATTTIASSVFFICSISPRAFFDGMFSMMPQRFFQ